MALNIYRILLAVMVLFAFLTFALSAGVVGQINRTFGGWNWGRSRAVAAMVFGLFSWLWFAAVLVLLFLGRSLPAFVDVIVMACLFVFGLGSVGALSAITGDYGLAQAAIAFGWLLIILMLATLIYEIVVIVRGSGANAAAFRAPFSEAEGGFSEKAPRMSAVSPVTTA